jgi:hypothetical protein
MSEGTLTGTDSIASIPAPESTLWLPIEQGPAK